MPGDPVQNKAGAAGMDRFGRQRMRSYGGMTADGIRAMIRCGLPPSIAAMLLHAGKRAAVISKSEYLPPLGDIPKSG